ncbi:hypothetical protein FHS18_002263 [Paenibacillus phyllosphaerae]|uniref:Inosine monophosphate cyclohydrolase-like domain-containing protein n=1 Tax=Paenibacillus phyllosphaerae TaxID=274593 RepID=A0A7W5AXY8_9BACL|nr:IMP cyclohydrolase [Paenibacillus phyllosphaerae]MBB3110196.1 hypothetical protein [Paenibacillus phyllosphaerae]
MKRNESALFEKPYPGRTLIVGMTPDASHYVQVYWIMGRSSNSRNRVFEQVGQDVRNRAFDPSLLEDPSLIIYDPIRQWEHIHIVANGDQTNTIVEGLKNGLSFEQALQSRTFEPDAPHYTPRISAVIDTEHKTYSLSILKTRDNEPSIGQRQLFHYEAFMAGRGHCIHTYDAEQDGLLKPFAGEPLEVSLHNSLDETADYYWQHINEENKIALLVKFIDVQSGDVQFSFRHKLAVEARVV